MTVMVSERLSDPLLTADFLAHLDTQLESARRMMAIVHEQGAAIRQRDVQNVVRLAGALQVEMHRRELIEQQRMALLGRAGVQLGIAAPEVTLARLASLMDESSADLARARSAELRGMLLQIQRDHNINRALMQQELAFLDHLLRLATGTGGYNAGGDHLSHRNAGAYTRRRVFDLEA